MLVRVPRRVLRYAIVKRSASVDAQNVETKLGELGRIRVENISVSFWRAIFSAEAALRIARRCKKRGDTLSGEVEATLQRYVSDLERLKVLKREGPTGRGPRCRFNLPTAASEEEARMDSREQWVRLFRRHVDQRVPGLPSGAADA